MTAAQNPRVLVIGAGAAGLLIAHVLKKQGVPCVVFEQDASLDVRPRDWNYGIYWAQSNLSDCLPSELVDQLQTVQVDNHTPGEGDFLPIFNGKTGERLVDLPAPYSLRLRRRSFLKLIAGDIDIQYGKRLVDVHSDGTTVTTTFEDGSCEKGRLLIGAEGAHSRVREYLLGKEEAALRLSEIVASATVARLPKDVALSLREIHPRYCIAFHPDGYFSWYGIHKEVGEPEDWEFMFLLSWNSESDSGLAGEAIIDDLKERAGVFGDPFRTIFRSIPSGTRFWHNRLSYWPTQAWDDHNGTVTLAGDAAHPMTFHRGQGLNNSILDASSLGRQIAMLDPHSPGSLSTVVAEYEKEMWERGKEAVETSNQNSLLIHDWEKVKNSPLFKAGLNRKVTSE